MDCSYSRMIPHFEQIYLPPQPDLGASCTISISINTVPSAQTHSDNDSERDGWDKTWRVA